MIELPGEICNLIFRKADTRTRMMLRCVSRQWYTSTYTRNVVIASRLGMLLEGPPPPRYCTVAHCNAASLKNVVVRHLTQRKEHIHKYAFLPYCRAHFHAYMDTLSFGDVLLTAGDDGIDICVLCLR